MVAGTNYTTGWEDKYYTRRDTSTECLGVKNGSVFSSLRFWYAVLYAAIIFVACPIYLITRPIFEFSMEGFAQIVRMLIVFVSLNIFSKSAQTNGIIIVVIMTLHLLLYIAMLCGKLNSKDEEEEQDKV